MKSDFRPLKPPGIHAYDVRSAQSVACFPTPLPGASCVSVYQGGTTVVAGVGSSIFFWDTRRISDWKIMRPAAKLEHVHSDTVSVVDFHSCSPTTLMSAADDGLLNVMNIGVAPEECLESVVNCQSAVRCAGFYNQHRKM